MKTLNSSKIIVGNIAFLLFTLAMIFILFLQQKLPVGIFFNADILSFFLILKTVFIQGIPYKTWHMSTGTYLFPDTLLMLISSLVTHWNLYYSYATVIVIQWLLFYFVLAWFIRNFLNIYNSFILSTLLTLFILTFIVLFPSTLFNNLNIGVHTSIATLTLLVLGMSVAQLNDKTNKYSRIISVFLITMLTVASDSLFLAWCIIPLLGAFASVGFFRLMERRACLLWLLNLTLATALGFILRHFTQAHPMTFRPYFSLSLIPHNLSVVYGFIANASLGDKTVLALASLASLILILSFIVKLFRIKTLSSQTQNTLDFLILSYYFFLFLFLTFSLLTAGPSSPNIRYFFILLISPILFLLIKYFHRDYLIVCGQVSVFFLALLFGLKAFIPWQVLKTNYMPPSYACIYDALSKYHVHHGIAGYWDAKPLIAFSTDPQLSFEGFIPPLYDFHWLTTSAWIHWTYDFAILRKTINLVPDPDALDETALTSINGTPMHSVHCGDYQILIYGTNRMYGSLATKDFAENKTLVIPASLLFSQTGLSKDGFNIASNGMSHSGFLTLGPYISLPKGNYFITLIYKASDLDLTSPPWFDISYQPPFKAFYHTSLADTDNELKRLSINLTINAPKDAAFEFRVYYPGRGNLAVSGVEVKKVG